MQAGGDRLLFLSFLTVTSREGPVGFCSSTAPPMVTGRGRVRCSAVKGQGRVGEGFELPEARRVSATQLWTLARTITISDPISQNMNESQEEQKRAISEKEKSFLGLPYNAMEDPELIQGRLRARKYVKAFNVSNRTHLGYI